MVNFAKISSEKMVFLTYKIYHHHGYVYATIFLTYMFFKEAKGEVGIDHYEMSS